MGSKLIVVPVEDLQSEISSIVGFFDGAPGVYVCLNRTQKGVEATFRKEGVNIDKLFFIDCVTVEKSRDDVLHISPHQLDTLNSAVHNFVKDIDGEKVLIIDALSTLLIYNEKSDVVDFIKGLIDFTSKNNTEIVAFTPTTKGEELLDEVLCFFDEVERK